MCLGRRLNRPTRTRAAIGVDPIVEPALWSRPSVPTLPAHSAEGARVRKPEWPHSRRLPRGASPRGQGNSNEASPEPCPKVPASTIWHVTKTIGRGRIRAGSLGGQTRRQRRLCPPPPPGAQRITTHPWRIWPALPQQPRRPERVVGESVSARHAEESHVRPDPIPTPRKPARSEFVSPASAFAEHSFHRQGSPRRIWIPQSLRGCCGDQNSWVWRDVGSESRSNSCSKGGT